jgi:hypothetical protein
MDIDRALELVNDPAMNAYCDYVHNEVFRVYGQYELGFDETYDEVAYAFAFVAVELALDAEEFEFVPHHDQPQADEGNADSQGTL